MTEAVYWLEVGEYVEMVRLSRSKPHPVRIVRCTYFMSVAPGVSVGARSFIISEDFYL